MSETNGVQTRYINRLSHSMYFKLGNWLQAHRDRLHTERPSFRDAAEQAQKDLGFNINAHSLRNAANELDLAWKPKFANRNPSGEVQNYYSKLRERMTEIEKENAKLRGAITWLANRLGEKIPQLEG